MMKIHSLTVGPLAENAYIVEDETQVIVVDPGAEYEKIIAQFHGKPCTHVLLTHAHFDHIGAAAQLQKNGAKIILHAEDEKLLKGDGNLSSLFGETLCLFTPDILLNGTEKLSIGSLEISVLATPGHTDGSVCYVLGDTIFSGDTLFYLSAGRTDFPSGNSQKLKNSLKNVLFALAGEYRILPGHDRPTLLSFEKNNNPYA